MKHGSLFSGIGGFDLAAEWMSWENVFHCEWNEFGQRVLNYYWPKAISYEDITKTDFSIHRGKLDILTGGFPCQPYSSAGKRLGKEDERHLWPEMLRAIREISPRWIVGENVLGLTNWNGGMVFEEVCADLEAEGYEVQPYILPAASVNAPHRRDRVWFVAWNTKSAREAKKPKIQRGQNTISDRVCGNVQGDASNTSSERLQRGNGENKRQVSKTHGTQKFSKPTSWESFPTKPPIRLRNDGVSRGLDIEAISESKWRNESIKAYGNAIVPQVVYQIFKAIEEYEN